MKSLKPGTLFAMPISPAEYLFGVVLLDIYGSLKDKRFPEHAKLPMFGKSVLVDMSSGTSDHPDFEPSKTLIKGAVIQRDAIGKQWPIVGMLPLDYREIEFPESTIGHPRDKGGCAFQCGEMLIDLPLPLAVAMELDVFPSSWSSFLWRLVCLTELGRADEVPEDILTAKLYRHDLRFTSHHKSIYRHFHFPMDLPYL